MGTARLWRAGLSACYLSACYAQADAQAGARGIRGQEIIEFLHKKTAFKSGFFVLSSLAEHLARSPC